MADNKRKATKNEKMSMKENERLLIEKFKMIKPVEKSYEEQAKRRWKTVAKPLFSLGKLEDAVIRMAGIRREADFEIKKKGLLIFCADNGVVSEGVTQTGQEVTAIVADNFTKCDERMYYGRDRRSGLISNRYRNGDGCSVGDRSGR